MRIVFIFIDGLGIGKRDERYNPCTAPFIKYFNTFNDEDRSSPVPFNGIAFGLDATLGIKGLPQSATGQTALLTGINAAKILGRHLNGFPNQTLRDIIAEYSVLKQLTRKGYKATFINAFRPPFFNYDPFDIIKHLSVTSVANLYAELPFFSLNDLRAKKCIYQEFTNEHLQKKGFDVPTFSPEEAGAILAHQSKKYDFCLYEYFQTDRAGHSQDMNRAKEELRKLELFLDSLLALLDLSETLVIVVSDHGNIEDLSFKGHTRNAAQTILWGSQIKTYLNKLHSITDLTPLITSILA